MNKDALHSLQKLQAALPGLAAEAMDYTMTWVEARAKRTTVFRDRSGRLRNSIRAGTTTVTTDKVVGTATAGANDGGGGIAASMKYAPRIELGFMGTDSLGRSYTQAPRPFIWPAVQQARAEDILPRALKSQLKAWKP